MASATSKDGEDLQPIQAAAAMGTWRLRGGDSSSPNIDQSWFGLTPPAQLLSIGTADPDRFGAGIGLDLGGFARIGVGGIEEARVPLFRFRLWRSWLALHESGRRV